MAGDTTANVTVEGHDRCRRQTGPAPHKHTDSKNIFLAGPFKSTIDPETGVLRAPTLSIFKRLIAELEGAGYRVHNAHRREAWGAQMLPPEVCTRLDFQEIRACDVFVGLPGSPASPGTHIEIGWAAAFGKLIVLLLEPSASYAFLVQGLHSIANVQYVEWDTTQAIPTRLFTAIRQGC